MRGERKQTINICVTGFPKIPGEETQWPKVQQLAGQKIQDVLNLNTNVLVIKKVNTEKFKIARLLNPPPRIVTEQWLINSEAKGSLEDFNKYAVPNIFYGLVVAMWGYKPLERDILLKKLNGKEGQFIEAPQSIDKAWLDSQCVDVIVLNPAEYRRWHQPFEMEPVVVSQEWLEKSIELKTCLWPEDYSYNRDTYLIQCYQRALFSVTGLYGPGYRLETSSKDEVLLEDVFIYLHNFNDREIQRIQHIVSAAGGWVMPLFSEIVTHVIPSSFNETDFTNFSKFGNSIEMVRLGWLLDSVRTKQKLGLDDYRFRRNKFVASQIIGVSSDSAVKEPPQEGNNNSMNFNTYSNGHSQPDPISIPPQLRKSVSISFLEKDRTQKSQKKVHPTEHLFKGSHFFVLEANKHADEVKRMRKKIHEYGGTLYDKLGSRKLDLIYLVMADDPEISARLQSFNKHHSSMMPVSFRWVDYCISKKCFIDPAKEGYFTFLPFRMFTPIPELLKCKFVVLGWSDVMKERICQLLEVVAHRPVQNFLGQVTHVICDPNYQATQQNSRIYQQLRKQQRQIFYTKLDWIMDSLNGGKLLPIHDFLLE